MAWHTYVSALSRPRSVLFYSVPIISSRVEQILACGWNHSELLLEVFAAALSGAQTAKIDVGWCAPLLYAGIPLVDQSASPLLARPHSAYPFARLATRSPLVRTGRAQVERHRLPTRLPRARRLPAVLRHSGGGASSSPGYRLPSFHITRLTYLVALLRALVNSVRAGANLIQLGIVDATKSTVLSPNANIATQTIALVETLCSDLPVAIEAFADADFSEYAGSPRTYTTQRT